MFSGLGGAWAGYAATSEDLGTFWIFLWSAVGVVGTPLLFCLAVFVLVWRETPSRQRDDARRDLDERSRRLDEVSGQVDTWERGDYSSAEWAHPEIEFVEPDGPDPGTWKGLAEMAEAWRNQISAWKAFRVVAN